MDINIGDKVRVVVACHPLSVGRVGLLVSATPAAPARAHELSRMVARAPELRHLLPHCRPRRWVTAEIVFNPAQVVHDPTLPDCRADFVLERVPDCEAQQ